MTRSRQAICQTGGNLTAERAIASYFWGILRAERFPLNRDPSRIEPHFALLRSKWSKDFTASSVK